MNMYFLGQSLTKRNHTKCPNKFYNHQTIKIHKYIWYDLKFV